MDYPSFTVGATDRHGPKFFKPIFGGFISDAIAAAWAPLPSGGRRQPAGRLFLRGLVFLRRRALDLNPPILGKTGAVFRC